MEDKSDAQVSDYIDDLVVGYLDEESNGDYIDLEKFDHMRGALKKAFFRRKSRSKSTS